MKKTILCASILAGLCAGANAQNPVLVKDIDTTRNSSSSPNNLVSFNNRLYFVADGKRWNGFGMVANRELWSSNGSAEGTKMVVDLNKTANDNSGSYPVGLKAWKDKLYFFAIGTDGKQNLYETDGSEAGTKQVTTSGLSVMVPYGRRTEVFTEFNNALYFMADDFVNGIELWKTDGTAAGTVMVKEINPAKGMFDSKSEISQLTVMGSNLYFFGNETSDEDSLQLWKTDGTTAGTHRIVSYKTGNSETVNSLTAASAHVYYTVNRSIYKSDGTTAGTSLFLADCEPYHLTSFKGEMLFQTTTTNPAMSHICITSNEARGYTVLKDVDPGVITLSISSTYYYPMNVVEDKLYFNMSVVGPSSELWQTDGTITGTTLIKTYTQADGNLSNQQFVKHNGEVYFKTKLNSDYFLNKTDGTSSGTVKLSTVGVEEIENLTSVDKVLFFTSEDDQPGQIGKELWKFGTDTTSGGGTTGLFESKADDHSVLIYPNPAHNVVNIAVNASIQVLSASLFDITGKQVEELVMGSNNISHTITHLEQGHYFYSIKTTQGVVIKKLIISK
ncbi:MAG: T9SS type A sorting domain-containing protein [Bacteroidota bacterium]